MRAARLFPLLALAAVAGRAHALAFDFDYTPQTTPQARAAFEQAAGRWSALYTDAVTIRLTVGLASFGGGIIADTEAPSLTIPYASVRAALVANATSAQDFQAIAGLQAGPGLTITTNYFSDDPNADKATPYATTVTDMALWPANAKVLGLDTRPAGSSDGSVEFATEFDSSFDYDPSDGIEAGKIDFVGVAAHELGHALGFVSGVDDVDATYSRQTNPPTSTGVAFVQPLDLFRRSSASLFPDVTADARAKSFSLDNGLTFGAGFSLGAFRGDGRQASHWKDNLGLGTMDPTAGRGELLSITENDIRAFDVIGYHRAVPEPASFAALGLGALALLRRRKR